MFGFFENKNKTSRKSIGDVIRGDKKKLAEDTKQTVIDALAQTDAQRNLYAAMAQRAINKARRAIDAGDEAGKRIAYNELKFSYGVYHYFGSLHNAFRTIKSQMDMNEMTENFAAVVNNLSKIRVPANTLDFNKLTDTALKGFNSLDMTGLDDMVQKLIEGSAQATNVSGASDSFLDRLISGEATLDTPYTAPAQEATAQESAAALQSGAKDDTADLIAMLDKINSGLNGAD